MRAPGTDSFDTFWSGSYRGHIIATLNYGNGWLVYLDHVLQHNKAFATAEAATAWLRREIDAAPSRGSDLAPATVT